jgi:hypothetical protein
MSCEAAASFGRFPCLRVCCFGIAFLLFWAEATILRISQSSRVKVGEVSAFDNGRDADGAKRVE